MEERRFPTMTMFLPGGGTVIDNQNDYKRYRSKCASVRPPPANRGACVDLGKPGGGAGGCGYGHGLCMSCGGSVVGLWSVCGRFCDRFYGRFDGRHAVGLRDTHCATPGGPGDNKKGQTKHKKQLQSDH